MSKEEIAESVKMPSKMLEKALGKTEIDAEINVEPKESSREIQSRLDFLSQMYAANKAKHTEEGTVDSDEVEED